MSADLSTSSSPRPVRPVRSNGTKSGVSGGDVALAAVRKGIPLRDDSKSDRSTTRIASDECVLRQGPSGSGKRKDREPRHSRQYDAAASAGAGATILPLAGPGRTLPQ